MEPATEQATQAHAAVTAVHILLPATLHDAIVPEPAAERSSNELDSLWPRCLSITSPEVPPRYGVHRSWVAPGQTAKPRP